MLSENMMKKMVNNNSEPNNCGVPNKKERHIVSWSQEEDDILREQIRLHGTENWTVIASKFKDKSTRQCRRRWFTYLNSDFKKGGWSPEEDMLLCEAQRLFGNKWTEIAKVVPGRTDNAVKNRFTTLCKKRAKEEALAKENIDASSYVNSYNKRVIPSNGFEGGAPLNKTRQPFAVLTHNNIPDQLLVCKETSIGRCEDTKTRGTFLKKDDLKVLALMQQAELLTSLASKVNTEKKTDRSLESAWTLIKNHLKQQNEDSGLVEDLRSWESDMYEPSPPSSEFSNESTLVPSSGESQSQTRVIKQNNEMQKTGCTNEENNMLICDDSKENNGELRDHSTEFSSPLHVTPMFRAIAAAIPSPKFSESEKHFLMKTLGMESPSSGPRRDSSRPPLCKRSLLHCL